MPSLPALPASLPSPVAHMPVVNHVEVLSRLALQFIEVRKGENGSLLWGWRPHLGGGRAPLV